MTKTIFTEQLLLPYPEAAKFLDISARKLFDLVVPRGPIPTVYIGRCVKFDKRDLIAFVDSLKPEGVQDAV